MSKNITNKNVSNQVNLIMVNLSLPESVVVVNLISKDWLEKLTVTNETKMTQIIEYLLNNNVDIDKLTLVCDCTKALRPVRELTIMEEIRPAEELVLVNGSESITVEEELLIINNPPPLPVTEIVAETIVSQPKVELIEETPLQKKMKEYYREVDEKIAARKSGMIMKEKQNEAPTNNTLLYWAAGAAAAIGVVGVAIAKITQTPTN